MVVATTGALAAVLPATRAFADPVSSPAGAFVIGDVSAGTTQGNQVEFWGAQWAKDNVLSGGAAPDSFKGWSVVFTPSSPCTGTFVSAPGNSSEPPATVDSTIVVLVATSVTKDGDVITGTYDNVAKVNTDPGYEPDPGHAGTGTVGGFACGGSTSGS